MSEQLHESSAFTGTGFDSMPSLYFHDRDIAEVSEYSDERLEEMRVEYMTFLQRDDLMPRATKTAQRILCHLAFEQLYRSGAFEETE